VCRLAAYVGPPAPLSGLLFDPPHSLEHQAYQPRTMLSAKVNVDGTGVVWWPPDGGEVLRYVTERTPWSDPNLGHLAPRLRATTALAEVRSATPGIPHGPGNVAPFLHEGLAFSHNGWLGGYRSGVRRALEATLPDDLADAVEVVSDSMTTFAVLLAALRETDDLAEAVTVGLARVATACEEAGSEATLNVVLTDGHRVVATRASHRHDTNTLFTLHDAGRWPGATVVASEPLDDDPAWQEVAPGSVVEVVAGRAPAVRPLHPWPVQGPTP
jgi:gamma-glutamyl hercynylcysteine S-oxide hydrolase